MLLRWYKPICVGLTLVTLIAAVAVWLARWSAFAGRGLVGIDFALYRELGHRWLDTGSMYAAWQFAPYRYDQGAGGADLTVMPGLYPPIAGPVFATWTAIPAILWWAIPAAVIGYLIWRWRPAPWTWPILALVLALPDTSAGVIVGNTTMWVVAGAASGLVWGWLALLVVVKPTLAPLLLTGVRRRSFWIGGAILAGVSLLMVGEWVRYLDVLRNMEGAGLLYSVGALPLVLALLIAWASRRSMGRHGTRWSWSSPIRPEWVRRPSWVGAT